MEGQLNDYDFDLNNRKKKIYYYYLLLAIAILASIAVYIFFYFQPPIYKSSGKFAVFYSNSSENTDGGMKTSTDLTKSIAESVKSRYFLEKVSEASGVKFDSSELDNNISNIIKADVVTNSNIMTVEFNNQNTTNLNKINNVFLNQLNASKIITDTNSDVTIQTIDPLYTYPKPTYPKPMTYAMATFVVIVVIGLLVIYSFTP